MDEINVREYQSNNQKWTIQRNRQHRAHKTKKSGYHHMQTNAINVNRTYTLTPPFHPTNSGLQGFTGDNAGSGRSSLFSSALDALGGAPTAQLFFCSFSFSGFDWLEQAVYVDSTVLFSMEKINQRES
jgi:hypothetical protein